MGFLMKEKAKEKDDCKLVAFQIRECGCVRCGRISNGRATFGKCSFRKKSRRRAWQRRRVLNPEQMKRLPPPPSSFEEWEQRFNEDTSAQGDTESDEPARRVQFRQA